MKRLLVIIATILVLILANTATSQCVGSVATLPSTTPSWYCPINSYITQQFLSQSILILATVGLAFAIAVAILIVGIAFKIERVRNFGVGELYEAFATAMILAFFLYLCAVLFGVLPTLFSLTANPYPTALNAISTTITSAQNMYSSIYTGYINASYYSSITVTASIGSAKNPLSAAASKALNSILPFAKNLYNDVVFFLYLDPASVLANLLLNSIYVLYTIYFLIVFFAAAAIPAFIVPGVIFRAILPTRPLGGILIAIGITFYLIVPLLFSISYTITLNSPLSPVSALNIDAVKLSALSKGTAVVTNSNSATSAIPQLIPQVENALSTFWLMVLLYPAIIIAISYAFVVQLSNFIGGVGYSLGSLRKVL